MINDVQLVKLANQSTFVKSLLGIDTTWKNIVKITPNSVHRLVGWTKDKRPIINADFRGYRRDGRTNTMIGLIYEDTFKHLEKRYGLQSYYKAPLYSYHLAPQEVCLTTGDLFPDPNIEVSTVDGYIQMGDGTSQTWATLHDSLTGNDAAPSAAADNAVLILATATTDRYSYMNRSAFLFDTSSIGAGNTVDSGIFKLYVVSKDDGFTDSVSLVASTPASNTDLVTADFDQFGTTKFATDLTIAGLTTAAYNTWTLNADGKAAVSLTSITKFGTRFARDVSNTAPTWSSGVISDMNVRFADTALTTSDPVLNITYTAAGLTASKRIIITS
jgi:hypothetical protein